MDVLVMFTCICCFVLLCICIFILICSVCTSVKTSASEWELNFSYNNNNNNNNNRNTAYVECKNKGDTNNNWGRVGLFRSHLENTWATYQETWSQGTKENSHIGHCTHTSESTNVKVQ